jgi:ribosomal protein S18 acetylase RimI-like enzyme
VSRQIAAGAHPLGGYLDGTLVTTRWIAFDATWIEYLHRTLVLAPRDAYAFDSYTHPELRRRRVNAEMSRFTQGYARRAGRHVVMGCVLPENRPALAAIRRYGYRATGRIGYTGIGRWRRYFAERDGAPLRWASR